MFNKNGSYKNFPSIIIFTHIIIQNIYLGNLSKCALISTVRLKTVQVKNINIFKNLQLVLNSKTPYFWYVLSQFFFLDFKCLIKKLALQLWHWSKLFRKHSLISSNKNWLRYKLFFLTYFNIIYFVLTKSLFLT